MPELIDNLVIDLGVAGGGWWVAGGGWRVVGGEWKVVGGAASIPYHSALRSSAASSRDRDPPSRLASRRRAWPVHKSSPAAVLPPSHAGSQRGHAAAALQEPQRARCDRRQSAAHRASHPLGVAP